MDYIGLVNRPDYHPPTFAPLSAKGGKHYVCVTMPDALRKGSQKQMMRSTGTTDEKIAQTASHLDCRKSLKLIVAVHKGLGNGMAGRKNPRSPVVLRIIIIQSFVPCMVPISESLENKGSGDLSSAPTSAPALISRYIQKECEHSFL